MADHVRTSVIIDGTRLPETSISSVSLHQSLNAHHSFDVRLDQSLVADIIGPATKKWIGKSISIGFEYQADDDVQQAPAKERFKGVVTRLGLSRSSGSAELVVSGHSPTYLFDDGPRSRSFTDKTPEEIIVEVTGDYSGVFEGLEISPKEMTDSLPYTVQYREQNYAFINRMANRYGEWCYYDGFHFHYGAKPAAGDTVKLDFHNNSLQSFDLSVQTQPPHLELLAYDYLANKVSTAASPGDTSSNDLGNTVIKAAKSDSFPNAPVINLGENTSATDLKKLAARQEQILQDEAVLASGSTREPALRIGSQIEVSDGVLREDFGKYIITSISHYVVQGGDYLNNFEAYPSEVTTPPLEALSAPPFCETQMATVTMVDDEDAMGRVKVKFPWQEGSAEASPYLRVASPYTGKDKGFYVIPEIDDKVLVGFENNSPDHPFVLTGFYNGLEKPEWYDKENRYKGFKTKGKNQLKFDDKNKHVTLSAPSSMTLSAGKKIEIKTGGKEDSEITIDVGMGRVNIVAKIVSVESAETVEINSQKEILLGALQKIAVVSENELLAEGKVKVEIKATQLSAVANAKAELKGAMVDVVGSGPTVIKGLPIKLN